MVSVGAKVRHCGAIDKPNCTCNYLLAIPPSNAKMVLKYSRIIRANIIRSNIIKYSIGLKHKVG